jgi:hypothetical protein
MFYADLINSETCYKLVSNLHSYKVAVGLTKSEKGQATWCTHRGKATLLLNKGVFRHCGIHSVNRTVYIATSLTLLT